MRTVTVTWDKANERFTASGTHVGREIVINAPAGEPGTGRPPTGFSATELLLAGAGACAAWDVVEILRKRRAHVREMAVTVEGEQQDEPPWTYTRVALHFRVVCDELKAAVLARVIRLSIVRYCSVITTIAGVAAIEATVELITTGSDSPGRQMIELSIPAVPLPGIAEPLADEDVPSQPS